MGESQIYYAKCKKENPKTPGLEGYMRYIIIYRVVYKRQNHHKEDKLPQRDSGVV